MVDSTADMRQDDLYAREPREPSVERRVGPRDRSMDRHSDRSAGGPFRAGPPPPGANFRGSPADSRDHGDKRTRGGRERGSLEDVRYPPDAPGPGGGGGPGPDPHAELRPERLMRGHHGGPPTKHIADSYSDQYGSSPKSGGGGDGRPGTQQQHGRLRDDYSEQERYPPDRSPRQSQHLDPSSAVAKTARTRRKLESMLRNDSLSSDPSDCVRPPPPKPHKHKKGKKQRQASLSSSDDEIQTTPECTSCDEQEIESESVSEKGRCPHLIHAIYYSENYYVLNRCGTVMFQDSKID